MDAPKEGWRRAGWHAAGLAGRAGFSRRSLWLQMARAWGIVVAAAIAFAFDALVPGSLPLLLIPLQIAVMATAELLVDSAMQKQERRRLDSPSIPDQLEGLREEFDEQYAMLKRAQIPPERLGDEQLRLVRQFRTRSDALRGQRSSRARKRGKSAIRQFHWRVAGEPMSLRPRP